MCVPYFYRNHMLATLIKSCQVIGGFIVFGPFPLPPPPFCQHFSTFRENPWSFVLQTTRGWLMGVGKFFGTTSVTLGQGHSATKAGCNLPCSHAKMRTTHPVTTKLGRYIPLFFLVIFFCKISNPFSPVEHSICHILGMVGPVHVKQKGNESTGCYAD